MLALFGTIGWTEILILAVLGLLIFGKRLPEVGRSLGKGIVEFKKGLAGVEDEVDKAGARSADATQRRRLSDSSRQPLDETDRDEAKSERKDNV